MIVKVLTYRCFIACSPLEKFYRNLLCETIIDVGDFATGNRGFLIRESLT